MKPLHDNPVTEFCRVNTLSDLELSKLVGVHESEVAAWQRQADPAQMVKVLLIGATVLVEQRKIMEGWEPGKAPPAPPLDIAEQVRMSLARGEIEAQALGVEPDEHGNYIFGNGEPQ